MPGAIDGLLRTPQLDKNGNVSRPWAKWYQDVELKTRNALNTLGQLIGQINAGAVIQGRTEGIGTTLINLKADGTFSSLDNVHDGTNYQRPLAIALTAGQVDLGKVGVIGQVATAKIADQAVASAKIANQAVVNAKIADLAVGSSKIVQNVMNNYSNNATVDSIDNLTNATIRVYGPGGPGTSWHQIIGAGVGPEIAAFSGAAPYNSDLNVYYDGAYHVSANGADTLPDGILFSGSVHTVAAGGAGGIGGGGGGTGGGGGSFRKF